MASFPRTLAIDPGASCLRLVEVGPDAKGRPSIFTLEEQEIPFDPAKTSELFPIYAQALTAVLGRISTKNRTCFLGLGGPAVFSRILKLPVADPAKARSLIGFEAQQTVPAIEQALWDYQILPSPHPGEIEGLILAIKKETVEEMCAAVNGAGCRTMGVTLAPAALVNCFYFNYPEISECALLIDIGARASTILLIEGPHFFIRVVPMGGGAVTQAVATDLQESFAGAEVLKKAKGFVHPGGAYEDPADVATSRISKLARGVMTRLHAEVERSITFFRSQQGGGKPTRAWLSGGGVNLGYTDLFFQEKLRIPVESFQPFRRFSFSGKVDPSLVSRSFAAWAVAVGTALQALPDTPVRINVQKNLGGGSGDTKKNRVAQVLGSVAGLALLLLPGIHGFWQSALNAGLLEGETQKVEAAQQALGKIETANKQFLARSQEMEAMLSLERERLRWPSLLEYLKKHSPPRLWITSLRLLPLTESGAESAGQGATPDNRVPTLEIEGMFETQSERADAEAVENFQKDLGNGGLLRNVNVLEREAPSYRDGKTDQVALRFRLRAEWPSVEAGSPPAPGARP